MAHQANNPGKEEIDFGQISKKIKGYVSGVNDSFFDWILFVKRNILILVLLIAAGMGLGYYVDSNEEIYTHKLFVYPNFGSVDYLYENVDFINAKLKEQDYDFLRSAGLSPELANIEIEPVIDIYNFINTSVNDDDDKKLDLFELITENGDVQKILEDKATSRNYKKHLVTIITAGEGPASEIIEPLLKYWNSSPYFLKMKQEYINNLNLKIAANDTVIKQIDAILNDFSRTSGKGTNLMYYNDNTELSEVLKFKNRITIEQGEHRIDKVNYHDVVTGTSPLMNMKYYKLTTNKWKYIYPIVFVALFILLIRFKNYYRRQLAKRNQIINNEL